MVMGILSQAKKYLFLLSLAALVISGFGCFSSRPEGPLAIDSFPLEQELPEADAPNEDECNLDAIRCTKDEQLPGEMLCLTRGYQSYMYLQPYEPKAWGPNLCQARKQLIAQLCEKKISPSAVDRINCIPDPSSGLCPVKLESCADDEVPQICTAHMYMDQKLAKTRLLKAYGINRCQAMNQLRTLACQTLLDPSRLTQIDCKEVQEPPEECPVKIQTCEKKTRPTTCKATRYNGENLDTPIIAQGSNACEAQANLYFLTCQRELVPSKLGSLDCVATAKSKP